MLQSWDSYFLILFIKFLNVFMFGLSLIYILILILFTWFIDLSCYGACIVEMKVNKFLKKQSENKVWH